MSRERNTIAPLRMSVSFFEKTEKRAVDKEEICLFQNKVILLRTFQRGVALRCAVLFDESVSWPSG